jgi:putative membrane protein
MNGSTDVALATGIPLTAGVLILLWLGWCYLRGLRRLRSHSRGRRAMHGRPRALAAGVAVTALVTAPPLGEVLEHRLSTHMAQHMTLIVVSGSLLAASGPGLPLLAGLPAGLRRVLVRALRRVPTLSAVGPHLAWGLQIGAMWLWHLPAAYDEAVADPVAHLAEHACFLLTGWLFWWYLLAPTRRRLEGPVAVLYLVAAIPPGAALGAVLTFSSHPLYPLQERLANSAGVDPLADQRLAGLVMWVPLDFAYVALAVLILGKWFAAMGRRWPEPTYLVIDDPVIDEPSPWSIR